MHSTLNHPNYPAASGLSLAKRLRNYHSPHPYVHRRSPKNLVSVYARSESTCFRAHPIFGPSTRLAYTRICDTVQVNTVHCLPCSGYTAVFPLERSRYTPFLANVKILYSPLTYLPEFGAFGKLLFVLHARMSPFHGCVHRMPIVFVFHPD